jgi:hypothetical protein
MTSNAFSLRSARPCDKAQNGENLMMKLLASAFAFLCVSLLAGHAMAASITNSDSEALTLQITEEGVRADMVIEPGETVEVCTAGCFLTLPNGDRTVLEGEEAVEIIGGAVIIE